MTRGNQRDIDRERAKKRNDNKKKKGEKSNFDKTKMTDAEIMREKQKKAEQKKQEEEEEEKKEIPEEEEKKVVKKTKAKAEVPNYLLGFSGGPGDLKDKKKKQKDLQKKKQN